MKAPRHPKLRRLPFHLERLEERCVMNGDPAPLAAVIETPTEPTELQIEQISQLTIADDNFNWFPVARPEESLPVGVPLFESIEQIPDWLLAEIESRYGNKFDTTTEYPQYPWWNWSYLIGDAVLFSQTRDADSTTNVQVEGVDEADLIETDGEFIYIISGQELIIVDARDSENLSISSRVELTERPTGMYLSGERLTLVSANQGMTAWNNFNRPMLIDFSYGHYQQNNKTVVTVLDVSDREAPTQVQRTVLDGRMVSSRMVAGQLRLVLQQENFNLADHLPTLRYETRYDGASQRNVYTYESRDDYLERVRQALTESLLPIYTTYSAMGEVEGEHELLSRAEILEAGNRNRRSATTLVTFDALGNTSGPADVLTIRSASPAVVYATEESLYLFGHEREGWNFSDETTIWKIDFDADDHSIELAAKGTVAGQLLNQFAADEHEGFLRVVTTVGWGGEGQSLSVLEQVGDELIIIGRVTGLAPGERVYSVRFAGDRAFAVTFRQVDPLFAIDLSVPTAPQVKGELKIPGFSDYLQVIDGNHLIGVGRDADELTGLFGDLQISIFDVTNLDDPQLAHRYSFAGGRETSTIVTGDQWSLGDGDHLAFSYFAEEQVLALPISGPDQVEGLQVFRIDTATGFAPLALIAHDSPILRSLQLGDKLIVVSADKITVHGLDNPAIQLDDLDLAVGSAEGLVELTSFSVLSETLLEELSWMSSLALTFGIDEPANESAVEVERFNRWEDQPTLESNLDRAFAGSYVTRHSGVAPVSATNELAAADSLEGLDLGLIADFSSLLA